jgi:SpoVK/Ycf46/Vps4 family AAA+-type ATPase
MRTLLLLLILVNFAGAKDAPRAELVATPAPTPYPVVTTGEQYEKLNAGDHYWRNGELLEKHWYGPAPTSTHSEPAVETPTPESAPGSPLGGFVTFILVVVILFMVISTLSHAGSHGRKEDPPIKYAVLKNVKEPMENTNRSLTVVPKEIVVIPDQDEFRLILREREAKIKEQALERDRRLAEAEALLRETELREAALKEREAARRETERQLSEAAAWNGLILPKETKEALQIHCEMLRNHQWYSSQGIPIPTGLLFYGPPGCGKTETARLLSKISGFAFVSLSSADLKVGYIGQAAVAIQRYFDEARQKAPCIVYIDEIDASCPTRTSGHNSVIDNEVNAQLLQEFDGIKTTNDQPVFVFASTNRVDLIDPAILERFTQKIEISLPTAIERFQLLDIFIGKVPFDLSPPEDIEDIEEEFDIHGYAVGCDDGGLFILYGSGRPQPLDATSNDEALLEAWNILMTPDMIKTRLATATEGQSGRQLKNMVTKATMVAVKRSYQSGVRRPVTFRESDFDLLDAG